ncbi:hypothetical protein O0L34_g11821 [Tuta absoluta]|nr:hypothetical protein O0L34_g11821 [Tuta absoluta]
MEPFQQDLAPCRIDRLPDELLLMVWKYLAARDVLTASMVCQRWERLCADRALLVVRRGDAQRVQPSLRILFVSARCTHPADLFLVTRNLHTLIVHERVPLRVKDVKALCEYPHLRHLDVFTMLRDQRELETSISSVYQRLNTLVLNDNILMSPYVLQDLIKSSNLTQLHMYGRSYFYWAQGMVALIASRRDQLTELTLRCAELPEWCYLEIGRCSNLAVLQLYGCAYLRDRTVMRLMDLAKLRVLHLTGLQYFRTKQLHQLISALPINLEELAISGATIYNDHVAAIAARLPNLHVLELWVTRASSDKLLDFAMILIELREFDIDNEFNISQLKRIATHPKLERLRCSKPSEISESEFNAAAGHLAPVSTPNMRYPNRSMRSDGEGWRSSIYYHWMVHHPPLPLRRNTPPPTDYENDYSLLGADLGCTNSLVHTSLETILENIEYLQPYRNATCDQQVVDITK